jgi:predicted molibdopterin-dependent oxidoreductase YjgC
MMQGVRSICPFCSMGCSLRIRQPSRSPYVGDIEVAALEYDADGPFNRGSLCGKGNMSLELLMHPSRLEGPWIATDTGVEPAGWDAALAALVSGLEEVRRDWGAGAIGLVPGPHLTNEEVRRVLDLARALGTPNVDGGLAEDRALLGGVARSCAAPRPVETPAQVAGMTAMLVVGDVFTQAPCIARPVLDSRYDRRHHVLAVLSARPSRTTWFGRPALRCRPATEVAALSLMLRLALESRPAVEPAWAAGVRKVLGNADGRLLAEFAGVGADRLAPVVEALMSGANTGIILGLDFGESDRPDLAAGLAAMLAEVTASRFMPLLAGPNALGLWHELDAAGNLARRGLTAAEMVESAVTGDLKALVGFSCNPLEALPGTMGLTAARRLALFAHTAPLPDAFPVAPRVLLPCATWGEKEGTVTNAFGVEQSLTAALAAPGSARSDLAILDELLRRIAPAGPAESGAAASQAPCEAAGFFSELDIHLRLELRERGAREVGSRLLLPEPVASHAADGWLTRHLSWPRHECPVPELVLSAADAAALDIRAGAPVRVRSRAAEAILTARIGAGLAEGTVLAPPHVPAVRRLMRWRLDPALRDLDLRPSRISVEPAPAEEER